MSDESTVTPVEMSTDAGETALVVQEIAPVTPARPKRKPYKFNAQRKEEYLQKLREGGRRHVSAREVGVTPPTVAQAMQDDPDFARQVMFAEMEGDDEVEDALRTAAISGNVTAALAWLYSRRPDRWADTRKVQTEVRADVTQTVTGMVALVSVEDIVRAAAATEKYQRERFSDERTQSPEG